MVVRMLDKACNEDELRHRNYLDLASLFCPTSQVTRQILKEFDLL